MKVRDHAAEFVKILWGFFLEGGEMDGMDLENAFIKSGLAERRVSTTADVGKYDDEGFSPGDELTFLTAEGRAVIERAAGT